MQKTSTSSEMNVGINRLFLEKIEDIPRTGLGEIESSSLIDSNFAVIW